MIWNKATFLGLPDSWRRRKWRVDKIEKDLWRVLNLRKEFRVVLIHQSERYAVRNVYGNRRIQYIKPDFQECDSVADLIKILENMYIREKFSAEITSKKFPAGVAHQTKWMTLQ